MFTQEGGIKVNSNTTETGRRAFSRVTEVGASVWGTSPWTLRILKEGTEVTTETYDAEPDDLDWVPPFDPDWGERGGTYDYEWIDNG